MKEKMRCGLQWILGIAASAAVVVILLITAFEAAMYLDFHYCPLVKAWQKAGCSDEEIAQLCDIAMCGDHGIGARFDSVLELPKCIAKGDDVCALRYKKAPEKKQQEKKL